VIKVGPQTTTEEIIRISVSKFMSVKNKDAPTPEKLAQNVVDSYSLFLTNGNEERKFTADEFPFKELERLGLDEEQKKLVKFQLKKSVEMVKKTLPLVPLPATSRVSPLPCALVYLRTEFLSVCTRRRISSRPSL